MTERRSGGSVYAARGGGESEAAGGLFSPAGKARFRVSYCSDIGGRPYQEDRLLSLPEIEFGGSTHAFFSVMDGHGGEQCAEFVRSHLLALVGDRFRSGDYEGALAGGFKDVEDLWMKTINMEQYRQRGWSSGSWVGDCRMASYSREEGCVAVTSDHKPNRDCEQARIERCGGEVRRLYVPGGRCVSCFGAVGAGPPRVYPGGLAVARSIGTVKCKASEFGAAPGCVISIPEYVKYRVPANARYLILASDGLWDYFPNTKGLGRVVKAFETSGGVGETLAQYILKAIRRRNLRRPPDNVTILVVALATAI